MNRDRAQVAKVGPKSTKRTTWVTQNGWSTKMMAKGTPQEPKQLHKHELFRARELSSAPFRTKVFFNVHLTTLVVGLEVLGG